MAATNNINNNNNTNRTAHWNGMVDLSGITKNSPGDSGTGGARNSGQTGQSDLSMANKSALVAGSRAALSTIPEHFSRIINTTEMLPSEISDKLSTVRGISAQERKLWKLTTLLLDDCTKNYDVEAVGVNSVPKSRHWHISQYRHAQHLLQSSKFLRRLNIVLRWLELTYDSGREQIVLNASGTPEQQQVLYQAVFDQIRGGGHATAIQTAAHAHEHVLETVLRSIGMLKAKEAFWKKTDRVELFGEYVISEEPDAKSVSNDHRKRLISQLYDESMLASGDGESHSNTSSTAAAAFHTAIKGALSGNRDAMSKAFEQKTHWTNKLWCEVRSKMVHILLRTHQPYDNKDGEGEPHLHSVQLVQAIDRTCSETGSNWVEACERAVEQDILGETGLLSEMLRDPSLDPIEALQIRVIQLFLSDAGITNKTKICSINPQSPATLRAHAHLLLLLDAAERSNYIRAPLQSGQNLNQLSRILVSHCGHVLAESGAALDTGAKVAKFALPILRKLRDNETRACAYATLLGYVRRRAKNLLVSDSNVSGAAATNNDAIEREESDILTEIRITESSHFGSAALLDRVLELMSSNVGALPIDEVAFAMDGGEDSMGGAAGGSPLYNNRAAGDGRASVGFNTTSAAGSIARTGGAEIAIVRPHEKAEAVAWLAKTNDPTNLQRVFDQAMDHNATLWEEEEYDAVRDIVSTLGSQVVPRISSGVSSSSSATATAGGTAQQGSPSANEQRYFFWEAVVMCHELNRQYVSTVQEINATINTVRKVRAEELTSRELRLRNEIRGKIVQCLDNSSVMSQNVACAIASAIGDSVETARASLNILAREGANQDPTVLSEMTLQRCLGYVDQFKQTGRMQRELKPIHARILMKKIHQLRVGLNLVHHIARVKDAQAELQ